MRLLLTFLALSGIAFAGQPGERLPDPNIHIDPRSAVTREAVSEILRTRGPKDPAEIWQVDRYRDDVRIRKYRSDRAPLAPGAAIEFWHQDRSGRWIPRPTA
jgi:hypothetical protein